ncbi:MAG: HNH endonuclease [Actinomycetota bacterium]|nr:HNH endonuclease [Actinomycetota bacterium]
MFVKQDGTVDRALERRREARRRELREICEREARDKQRVTEIVREAEDDGDWQAAGCSSSAQWLAQVCSSDHRSAVQITRTSSALRSLPALDHALSVGVLTLDQVAAAAEFATAETDAELARVAVGKAPSAIALAARTLAPPTVTDDEALYERRSLSMTWTPGRRELVFGGRLPLEQGVVFEQAIWSIAKEQRAADKQAGTILEWRQSAGDALVTLARQGANVDGGVRRSPSTLIVHLSRDEPALLEGAGPLSPETADRLVCDARRLTIKASGRDLVRSRVGRCASYAQQRTLYKRSGHCQYPGCTAERELDAHHIRPAALGGTTELDNLILLCPRHHKLLHDHHIRTTGTGGHPAFTDAAGRAITTNQPHAPPR